LDKICLKTFAIINVKGSTCPEDAGRTGKEHLNAIGTILIFLKKAHMLAPLYQIASCISKENLQDF